MWKQLKNLKLHYALRHTHEIFMTIHILSTTSPGKGPRKSSMSEPKSAADRLDGSLWGSKFSLCRSYYRANQQLQRSFSNRSKSFLFPKLLMHNVTLHWLNICFSLDNRLDSLAHGGGRLEESGPVDPHPLRATVYPQPTLWANWDFQHADFAPVTAGILQTWVI